MGTLLNAVLCIVLLKAASVCEASGMSTTVALVETQMHAEPRPECHCPSTPFVA